MLQVLSNELIEYLKCCSTPHYNEVITLNTGLSFIHDMKKVNDKLYAVTRDSITNHFIRFNNIEDLTDYDTVVLPYGGSTLVIVGNVAYLQYFSPVNDQHLRVGAVNLTSLALTMPLDEVQGGFYPYYSSGCTDGTYYYNASAGASLTVNKYRLSDWVNVGQYNATGHYGRGHDIIYDDGMLYITSYQTATLAQGNPAKNWVIKVDATKLLEIDRNETFPSTTGSVTAFTDDGAIANNKLFIGVEINHTNTGNIFVFDKNNLSSYSTITIPEVGGAGMCLGVFYYEGYIYAQFSNGVVSKIDPINNNIIQTVNTGILSPNEMAFSNNGREIFMTYYLNPAQISRTYNLFI